MIAIKYGRRSSRWVVSMDFTSKDLQPADDPTPAKAKTQRKWWGLSDLAKTGQLKMLNTK